MPEVKLGLEAVLTIDGAEITNVKDLTVSLEKAEADASTRANNGWRDTVGTLKDASLQFILFQFPSLGTLVEYLGQPDVQFCVPQSAQTRHEFSVRIFEIQVVPMIGQIALHHQSDL